MDCQYLALSFGSSELIQMNLSILKQGNNMNPKRVFMIFSLSLPPPSLYSDCMPSLHFFFNIFEVAFFYWPVERQGKNHLAFHTYVRRDPQLQMRYESHKTAADSAE